MFEDPERVPPRSLWEEMCVMWTFGYAPGSPEFRVDWDNIQRYAWIQRMNGVQQDPDYHAEGDVLVHTRMVARAMAENADYRLRCRTVESHALFASACYTTWPSRRPPGSKTAAGLRRSTRRLERSTPATSCTEPTRERSRRSSSGVDRSSWCALPRVTAQLLQEERSPVGRPRGQPAREPPMGAILAKADVIGRITKDEQNLLDSLGMFENFCLENGCCAFRPHLSPITTGSFVLSSAAGRTSTFPTMTCGVRSS